MHASAAALPAAMTTNIPAVTADVTAAFRLVETGAEMDRLMTDRSAEPFAVAAVVA